jgi:sec-independent protein translocase protein TatC
MQDKELTIVEHLNELRKRVIYVLIAVVITAGTAYHFIDEILDFITSAGKIDNLVFISPTEAFFVIIKLSILVGVIAAMPFIFYQVWKYVGVALKKKERKYLIYFGPVSFLLFLLGAGFAFRTVLPLAMRFLLSFSKDFMEPMITLNSYVSFLIKMITAFGLMFELPLVVLFLSKLGLVTPEALKKGRRYAIVVIFVAAAVLTPPDVISQIMLAVPILILYEISIWICKSVTKKREQEMELNGAAVNEA